MPGSEPRIRRAGIAQADALLPLIAGFHAHEGIAACAADRRGALHSLLETEERGAAWLADSAGRPVGYVILTRVISVEFGGWVGVLDELFVLPGHRGRGIARGLIEAALAQADAGGLRAVFLEAERDAAHLHRLYAGAGFGRRARYATFVRPAAPQLRPAPQPPTG